MMTRCAVTILGGILVLSLAACASLDADKGPVSEVRQITQSDYCGLTGPGLAYVESPAELEPLLGVSGQNLSTQLIREVDLAREHLVFVTLGQKPTAGYSVALEQAHFSGDTLALEMQVRQPASGSIVAQVITSPCAVVAVPGVEWRRLEVSGVTAKPLIQDIAH